MAVRITPVYGDLRAVTHGQTTSGTVTVWGVILNAGSDAAVLTITGASSGTLEVNCLANDTKFIDLSNYGGITLGGVATVSLTGTSPTCWVWSSEVFSS